MISGVVLAAGGSSRLGRPKQLLPLAGQPLLTHVLRHAAASSLDEVVLVLGHEAATIMAAIGEWGQRIAINPDFAAGQSTSLRVGLGAIDPTSQAALFLVGDQPTVDASIIDAVLHAYRASGGPIVRPVYEGRPGNPVLFDRSLFADLSRVTGDEGARSIVWARLGEVVDVPIEGRAPPPDVDTVAEYEALLAGWSG